MSAASQPLGLAQLNALPREAAREALLRCCGSGRWVADMAAGRPFESPEALLESGERAWWKLSSEDWLEAFGQHPRIGDLESLRHRFETTAGWARGEQAGVGQASEGTLRALAEGNRRYEEKFGYIFIVCASGLSAAELLARLEERLGHHPSEELRVAAGEQARITRLRLEKLMRGEAS